jgi:hypothetical protein
VLTVAVGCHTTRADIVFVVDSTRSICNGDSECAAWTNILNFIRGVINLFNIGSNNIQVGLVRFAISSAVSSPFYLNSNLNKNQLMAAVSSVSYQTGNANGIPDLHNALLQVMNQQFTASNGDRLGAPNIVIILTNGGLSRSTLTQVHCLLCSLWPEFELFYQSQNYFISCQFYFVTINLILFNLDEKMTRLAVLMYLILEEDCNS